MATLRVGRRSRHPRALLACRLSGVWSSSASTPRPYYHSSTTDQTEFQDHARATPSGHHPATTRLFILNSPSNPTGSLYTLEEINALGDICVQKNVLIYERLEIYEKLVYDGAEHVSVAEAFSPAHYEHTIIVHGFAKAYSMTGWRLGYLCRARTHREGH